MTDTPTTAPKSSPTKAAAAVAKRAATDRHTVTVPTALYNMLEKAAQARMVGVSMLAGALIEYGLDHLADPELFDD